MHRFALLALVGTLGAATSCSPMVYTNGVPNLREVEPGLWRGGQPTDNGWLYLHARGVKTVVKLNFDTEGSDDGATALGLSVRRVPFPPSDLGDMLKGPTVAQMQRVQALLADPSLRPLYIHCTHGQDRTGLAVGVYRVSQGWPKSKAWREMQADDYHELLLGLTDFWHDHVSLTKEKTP